MKERRQSSANSRCWYLPSWHSALRSVQTSISSQVRSDAQTNDRSVEQVSDNTLCSDLAPPAEASATNTIKMFRKSVLCWQRHGCSGFFCAHYRDVCDIAPLVSVNADVRTKYKHHNVDVMFTCYTFWMVVCSDELIIHQIWISCFLHGVFGLSLLSNVIALSHS